MIRPLDELPADVRERTADAIRQRRPGLLGDLSAALADEPGLDSVGWTECAGILLTLLATAVQGAEVDGRSGAIQELSRLSPPVTVRQLIRALHRAERIALDELALHEHLGATSESWPAVAHAVRGAMVEVAAVVAERHSAAGSLRDHLTTLVSPVVFEFALAQEALRAHRHAHGIAVILFDIDDLSELNRTHGYGAGDRLLERLGILGRQFFRTHDWVARHGGDSIAVLLPETTLDQASALANRFRDMVQQRLVLVDHKTESTAHVTVSAAAVGTELVHAELDPVSILAEAEGAVTRAKMNGGNCLERVGLLPTSVTLGGAATLLGIGVRDVVRLLRRGSLQAARRGRHLHIERDAIEECRKRL